MHASQDYLVGLAQLGELTTPEERRAAWRQGLAALATAAADQQPTPLEGSSADSLLTGVRIALATGLVDDLGWLSRPLAAAALFELASALPQGREKRDLGRRVLQTLHEGDAATFVTLARALALGSRRALGGPVVRARVALSLRLPIATGASADGLALALLSRPELEREWLSAPSTGALPSRRLAARLIERAAREAARRSQEGDDSGVRVFQRPSVRVAWLRLLADRESLVWRHVATARGLLLGADPTGGDEVERALSSNQGPTEWRRAAASLAASIAHDPQNAAGRCRELARGDLAKRDPGILVAMVHGLTRAGEEEPETSEELLAMLVDVGDIDVLEALVDVRREHVGGEFGVYAAGRALARLQAAKPSADDGLSALRQAIYEDLAADEQELPPTLSRHLSAALLAFAEGRELRGPTELALMAARATMSELENLSDNTPSERQRSFHALRELDRGLLETSTLSELLTVCGHEAGATGPAASASAELLERLSTWILSQEERPLQAGNIPHAVLRLRRLRTLLHLLDVDVAGTDETPSSSHSTGTTGVHATAQAGAQVAGRDRRLAALRLLLGRLESDPASPLRRTVCAALARACDALVRDEVCELSDILVAISTKVRLPGDLDVLSEASMVTEVQEMFRASAELVRMVAAASNPTSERSFLDAFVDLAQTLPPGTSPRVEGMRRALLGMARALQWLHKAQALAALRHEGGRASLERLEDTLQYAAKLCAGVRRRLGLGGSTSAPTLGRAVRDLDSSIERACRELEENMRADVQPTIEAARADLPAAFAEVVARVLNRVGQLQAEASMEISIEWAPVATGTERLRLPPWLPPSRIVGGFYVLRPIGTGGGGSVFVARRAEDRHDENAETFALKIPSFDGQNAHTLTEAEFMQMFRAEAGALLTLPQHQNLAGFVTFDARARPKPILVMELVRGPTLERVIDKRELSVPFALKILDGVAAGLTAMHESGIGHLDVKPGNIILRESGGPGGSKAQAAEAVGAVPVLVDFGLAGRKVRPGCASPYYGAPEVWDAGVFQISTGPTAVDVYAYCCLAFELLAGRPLFDGETLPALISGHLAHNGNPAALNGLRSDRQLAPLGQILAAGLARDPRRRASMLQVRDALRSIAPQLQNTSWPVAA
jgi:eukaryotic-like serine/threonine-protein kinase